MNVMSVSDRQRQMNYQFLMLPYPDALKVLLWFDLIENSDERIDRLYYIFKLAYVRATTRGILDSLEAEISRQYKKIG